MFNRIFKLLPVILFSLIVGCTTPGLSPDADNTPPKAYFSVSPTIGDSTMSFVLEGSNSSDAEDISQFLEFRWDLNCDGVWDTEFSTYPYLIQHFPVPGLHKLRMEVRDRHGLADQAEATVETYGINHDTSRNIDSRDGQAYRTVRVRDIWWMAENLNFGISIRDTQMSRDNGIYEKYSYQNDPTLKGLSGGYYTYYHWDEVIDYDTIRNQGLCPPGWKLPGRSDWDSLLIPFNNRGLRIYFGEGGYSGLNLTSIGIHELTKVWEPIDESPCSAFWMYFTRNFQKGFYMRHYGPCPFVISSSYIGTAIRGNNNLIRFVNDSIMKNGGALPVRCIKIAE
ncbi:MAG: hypothetical protein D4R64_06915 [Porphyromonadaceae bacterium]|nr:MAG: hypothetical protein D4R64_06915 [Porphyromonadaceae bacterium]